MAYFSRRSRRTTEQEEARASKEPRREPEPSAIAEEEDEQLDAEDPMDGDGYVYARKDEYIRDENYVTIEDEMFDNLYEEFDHRD